MYRHESGTTGGGSLDVGVQRRAGAVVQPHDDRIGICQIRRPLVVRVNNRVRIWINGIDAPCQVYLPGQKLVIAPPAVRAPGGDEYDSFRAGCGGALGFVVEYVLFHRREAAGGERRKEGKDGEGESCEHGGLLADGVLCQGVAGAV